MDNEKSAEEFIGIEDEHVNKINVRERDNDNEFQGSVISLVDCNESMLQSTVEALVDKEVWIADIGATRHVTNSRIGGVNHHNVTVKPRRFIGESISLDLKWTFWSRTLVMMASKLIGVERCSSK